jgi:hypothetical protein
LKNEEMKIKTKINLSKSGAMKVEKKEKKI